MDLGTGITSGVAIITGGAIFIKWMSVPKNKNNDTENGNGNGVCPAHRDLVLGLSAFRKEVSDQFANLTKEIMELCKEVKRG